MVKNKTLLPENGTVIKAKVRSQQHCSTKCPNFALGAGHKKNNFVGFFCTYQNKPQALNETSGHVERCEQCLRDEIVK